MLTKRIFIFISVLSLSLGLLISLNDTFTINFIAFIGNTLHRNLDGFFWKIGIERLGVELILISINYFLTVFFYKKNQKLIILISCLLWVLLFIIYILKDSLNFPIADDYHIFLTFLTNYASTHDFELIVGQCVESRIATMKLIGLLLFHLDAFNFKTMILISTACLIGISLLLYKSIHVDEKQKTFLFLIITILFFQFQYYDSVVFASDALYNTCTVFFVFCSIYFLNKPSKFTFLLAMICALLATFNCGSGFMALISGMFLLITQKRNKYLLGWLLFSIGISILYFMSYSFQGEYIFSHPAFSILIDKIFKSILFSFIFLGSPFQFLYQTILPMVVGCLIWLYFFILTFKKYYKKNPAIFFLLFFLLLTSILPSLMRSNYPIEEALGIRYGIYSITALCCCVISYIEISNAKTNKLIFHYFLAFSIMYHLSTNIFFYPEVVIRKEKLKAFMQKLRDGAPYDLPPHTPTHAETIIQEAAKKNIYTIPSE